MNDKYSYEVTVKEAMHEDAGRGIARLSPEVMQDLGLTSGDVIEIAGGKKAAAIVQRDYSAGFDRRVIRIDGNIRSDAQTGIDEKVTIRKVEAPYAEKLVISSAQPVAVNLQGTEQDIARILNGRAFTQGQTFRVSTVMGNVLTFIIAKISPGEIAVVGPNTKVEISDKAAEKGSGKKEIPDVHYEDIGGLGREVDQVREMIELPLRHPEIFEKLGIQPPKGVLLYGPPGTGKTLIAKAVANEVDAHFITLSGPEIISKFYGESEGKLREVFDEAAENAPTIIFIDEIDSIAPKREETKGEVERRVVAQLLTLMDGLKGRGQVIVIGATNLPDNIDPALRRGGRFDREIEIGIPDKKGRQEIFLVHTRGVPIDLSGIEVNGEEGLELSRKFAEMGEIEGRKQEEIIKKKKFLEPFAAVTHGFVGADIALLVKEAAMHALRKEIKTLKNIDEINSEVVERIKVTKADFEYALKHVEPSAMREVLVEIPDVSWEDIGGLENVKKELTEAVEWPLKYPEIFNKLGTKPPSGILLFGPPGTGKTLLAKAVANKSECNFISVKGPELLSKWVGESEKGVRDLFKTARQASPSIIFFDEIDALLPKRGAYNDSSHVTESVVSQILTELDGLEELTNVTVLGATNRPDMLDDALMRPGRLDRIIYVPPPDAAGRKKIFEVYLKDSDNLLAKDISIDELVEKTEGYVGADIELVVREAKLQAMREFIATMADKTEEQRLEVLSNVRVTRKHFEDAMKKIKSSLDKHAIQEYDKKAWKVLYSAEENSVLEKGASAVMRLSYGGETEEKTKVKDELEKAVYSVTKDFDKIADLTRKAEYILKDEQ